MEQNQVETIIRYITPLFSSDYTGHDLFHTLRVYTLALRIAKKRKSKQRACYACFFITRCR